MMLLLLGAPGAGKGTQAKLLQKKYNMFHLAPGDILRDEIAKETELGKIAKHHMDQGHLVPNELVIDMLLSKIDKEDRIILDGFPRNIGQAEALTEYLESKDRKLRHVINIQVGIEEIIRRLSGRRVCKKCGSSYNIVFNPSKVEGICDVDGEKLVQRKDDTEETIKQRFSVYNEVTKPLCDYYREFGLLEEIDGEVEFEKVFEKIDEIITGEF